MTDVQSFPHGRPIQLIPSTPRRSEPGTSQLQLMMDSNYIFIFTVRLPLVRVGPLVPKGSLDLLNLRHRPT
jgi:hypothetical protein